MRLAGRTAVVTGGGSGVGRAAAMRYAADGASVLVADIDGDAAAATVAAIRDRGGNAEAFRVDLASREEVFGMIDAARGHFGRLDVLANVAAVHPTATLAEMTEAFWDGVLAVDLKGPLFACQAALPHMRERGGVIVNVASDAAFCGIPGLAAYSAAAAGLVAPGRVVVAEAGRNVRLNTVVPGATATAGAAADAVIDAAPAVSILERSLAPEEVADVIVWVSSDAAGSVNGALIRVDAGRAML